MDEETLQYFTLALIKSISSIPSEDDQVDIAKEQLKNFILNVVVEKENLRTRNFIITPDMLEGVIEGDLFASNMLNFITMSKKEAPNPLTLKQFLTRNVEIINFEARRTTS